MKLPRRLPDPGFPLRAPTAPVGVEVPAAPAHKGHDYDTSWARRGPARWTRAALVEGPMRAVVRGLSAPTRAGADRLAELRGPVIFAANHHSHLDTPLLLTSIPARWRHRVVVAAAADYFFATRAASVASALAINAFPIDRGRVSRESADRAAELLADRWSLLIFPEGGRSPDGWGQGHRGGAAYLSIRTGVPVVPVHLDGTSRIFARGDRVPKPGTTRVTFGAPLQPAEGEDARRLAARIEEAVAVLADEATSDWWAARRRAHRGTTPSLTGPDTASWRRAWALEDRRGRRRRPPAWPPL